MPKIPPKLAINPPKPPTLAQQLDTNFKNTALQRYDTNHDGKVSVFETNAHFNTLLKETKAGKGYIDSVFKKLDIDDGKQDGKVKINPQGAPAQYGFGVRFDLNRDNTVTRAEVDKSILVVEKKAINQKATLSASDTNKDGVISQQEYKKALADYQA